MENRDFITIPELAKLLGISRIAVYKQVKKGQIPAKRLGRIYVIPASTVEHLTDKTISEKSKEKIDVAVKKTVAEYGDVLKMLGGE